MKYIYLLLLILAVYQIGNAANALLRIAAAQEIIASPPKQP